MILKSKKNLNKSIYCKICNGHIYYLVVDYIYKTIRLFDEDGNAIIKLSKVTPTDIYNFELKFVEELKGFKKNEGES